MKGLRSLAAIVSLVVVSTVMAGVASGAADRPCLASDASASVWPSWGRDLSNSRDQSGTTISTSNVSGLNAAWALPTSGNNGVGAFESTPVEAGGCMFATTTEGSIFATDARTGKILWQTFEPSEGALAGLFAPAYVDGVLYAIVGRSGVPYVVALDASNGNEQWNTPLYQDLPNGELHAAFQASSVVVYDDLVFVALVGTDSFEFSHPSFFMLDAKDGSIRKQTTVVPQDKWLDGYSGGGIWATAVVDTRTGYLYVGTTNPYDKRKEYKFTNAIIKVDMDRHRKTFGEIVGHYRGDYDYTKKDYNTPQCQYLGDAQLIWYSYFCGQKDVDFGASPSLYRDSSGRSVVVELQKSCTLHAVLAGSMHRLWKRSKLAKGGLSGCAGGTAYDDHAVYVGVNEGVMYALDKDTGTVLWKTDYRDPGSNYHPVTVAEGVVYTIGDNGHLYAFDNQTGRILLDRQLKADGQTCTGTQSSGISIAYDTVYVSCDATADGGSAVFAYR